jgi:hypothetical protein
MQMSVANLRRKVARRGTGLASASSRKSVAKLRCGFARAGPDESNWAEVDGRGGQDGMSGLPSSSGGKLAGEGKFALCRSA